MGSFAGISASLNVLCRKTELPVYIIIAEALEIMEDPAEFLNEEGTGIVLLPDPLLMLTIQDLKEVAARTANLRWTLPLMTNWPWLLSW